MTPSPLATSDEALVDRIGADASCMSRRAHTPGGHNDSAFSGGHDVGAWPIAVARGKTWTQLRRQ